MPAESVDRRSTTTKVGGAAMAPPPENEHLPCPRCDSTNTKFCYYNNYNFSQPRHFCKACRRYWTQGGTLRDIPVGGGTRKNAKRSRTLPPTTSPATSSPSVDASFISGLGFVPSFTSLLNANTTVGVGSGGLLGLGGLGLGIGPGFDDSGFVPIGRAMWAFPEVGYGGNAGVHTWQMESGGEQAAAGGGDCFCWPELAISTPGIGNGLK